MPTVAPLDLDGHCVAAAFIGDVPFFALADGTVHRLDHGHKTAQAHDGLLTAVVDSGNAAADHRRRGRQGRGDRGRRRRRDAGRARPQMGDQRRAGPAGRDRLRLRPQRLCPLRRRQGEGVRASALGRRAGLLAEGHALRRRALQWRDAAFPGRRRQAGRARMGRRAYRRSHFRPTAISSSPPCRRTRCMAGSSPTASTCA